MNHWPSSDRSLATPRALLCESSLSTGTVTPARGPKTHLASATKCH